MRYYAGAVKVGFIHNKLKIYFYESSDTVFDITFSNDSVVLESYYEKYDEFETTELVGFIENSEIKNRIVEAIHLFIESNIN